MVNPEQPPTSGLKSQKYHYLNGGNVSEYIIILTKHILRKTIRNKVQNNLIGFKSGNNSNQIS